MVIATQGQKNCYALLLECETLTDSVQLQEAMSTCTEAYTVCLEEYGFDSYENAWAHVNLSLLNYYFGEAHIADSLMAVANPLVAKHCGIESIEYATILVNRGGVFDAKGNYVKAMALMEKAAPLYKNFFGEQHENYGSLCNGLAIEYMQLGYWEKALYHAFKSLEIAQRQYGTNTALYVNRLNTLGIIYLGLGEYEKAYQPLLQAKNYYESNSDTSNIFYLVNFQSIGQYYIYTGQYELAMSHYDKGLALLKSLGMSNQPLYAAYQATKLSAYSYLGQFEELKNEAERTLKDLRTGNNAQSAYTAIALDRLISYYLMSGNPQLGIQLAKEALDLFALNTGKNSANYLTMVYTLSHLLFSTSRYDEAVDLGEQNSKDILLTFGENHYALALQQGLLARAYFQTSRLELAKSTALNNLVRCRRVFGEKNPRFPAFVASLLVILDAAGEADSATKYFRQFTELTTTNLFRHFNFLSEKEQLSYLAYSQTNLEFIKNFVFNHRIDRPELARLLFDNNAALKEALLDDTKARQAWLAKTGDEKTVTLQNEWVNTGQALAKQYSLAIDKRTIKKSTLLDSMEQVFNHLERRLANESSTFREVFSEKKTTWDDVRAKLGKDEAVVDFFRFQVYHPKGELWPDSILYCALVGKQDFESPKLVFLFEEAALRRQLGFLEQPLGTYEDVISNVYSQRMRRLVWQPLDSLLEGINTIWYCPEGLLHKVSFAAIPNKDGGWLGQQYELRQVGSPRDILQYKPLNADEIKSALVYGGIEYELDDDRLSCLNATGQKQDVIAMRRQAVCGGVVPYLKGAELESNEVETILEMHHVAISSKRGCEASEDHFKATCRGANPPSLIHLPTHGLFCRPPATLAKPGQVPEINVSPLFYSSLALAGFNRKAKGGQLPTGFEDGELSAYEAAHLPLSNTRLVVLSACVSGLGELESTEGVFGLQRAFRTAGADHVLVSLWQVHDIATATLMKLFYENWFDRKMGARQALRTAQEQMRNDKKYGHPYYWAGFVLI